MTVKCLFYCELWNWQDSHQSPDKIKSPNKNFIHRCLSSLLLKHISLSLLWVTDFCQTCLQNLLTFSQYSHQYTYIYWIILCIPKGGLQPYNCQCSCLQNFFHWMDKYCCLQKKLYIKRSLGWLKKNIFFLLLAFL